MADGNRKLAAILVADVAGYSRLMQDDEDATIAALDRCRAVFRARIAGHDGRVVDTAGDSVLAVLATATGAVSAANEIQQELAVHNQDLPDHRRMEFRIGVNLGKVVEKHDGTIYGDGVNIAARLEGLATPGEICVSESAHMQVRGKLDVGFEDLGVHAVKNIAEPVRAYRVTGNGMTAEAPLMAVGDKPSVAVLPFDNLSGDAEQEYFVDGITEDLITELSRLRWLAVTARNSTFTYKGQPVDVKQVGHELGVRFLVEGSVRKGGSRLRITAQLIEAETGNHIWAERYDRELADIFDLQDEITETLVAALQNEVGAFERARVRRKPPDSLDAWESYQRGMWQVWRMGHADLAEAESALSRAIKLDGSFPQAFAALGYVSFLKILSLTSTAPDRDLAAAQELAEQAIALDGQEFMGHYVLGRVQTMRSAYEAAIAELRTAIDLNPSSTLGFYGLGFALILAGRAEEAIAQLGTAIRLSPRDPFKWASYNCRSWAHNLVGDFDAAVRDGREAVRHKAAQHYAYINLTCALAHAGQVDEARKTADKLLETQPDFDLHKSALGVNPSDPDAVWGHSQIYADGLRLAGVPDSRLIRR